MVEDMIVFAEHGEEAKSDAVTLLYVSDGEAVISFPGSLPDGGMKEGSLVPGDLLFLAPGVEYKLQASGQVISISLTSPPPLPEDGNVLAGFFSSPSGFLLFRTGNDPFLREDFQRIFREGQDRRPFHQEIIRSTLAQDFLPDSPEVRGGDGGLTAKAKEKNVDKRGYSCQGVPSLALDFRLVS